MTTVTYGGISIGMPEPIARSYPVIIREAESVGGYAIAQAGVAPLPSFAFKCHATSYTEISLLANLIGNPLTLVIDGNSYTQVLITRFSRAIELLPDWWEYEIEFKQYYDVI